MSDTLSDNGQIKIPLQSQLEQQQEWVDNFLAVLESYKMYTPDQKRINQFLNTPSDYEIYDHYAFNLVLDIMGRFHQGITQKEKRFNVDYFRMLYKLYMMIGERFKLTFHEHFIGEWQHFPIDYCLYFEQTIPDFSRRLDNACGAIVQHLERVEPQVKEEFRWLLLLCPVNVLKQLFTRVISNPALIDFTIHICTQIPSLFYDRDLKIWHNEHETQKVEPLLAVVMRRFIHDRQCIPTDDDRWDAMRRLFLAFCRGEKPLLSRSILLDVVFDEIYSGTHFPIASVEMLTEIAATLLESKHPLTHVFATSRSAKPAKKVYMTPTIIIMLLELMKEYHKNKKSISVIINCKRILNSIGTRMSEQERKFDQQTKDYLIEHLSEFPWFVKFAISTWFGLVNDNKRCVPLAIFQAIYPNSRSRTARVRRNNNNNEQFELIHFDDEEDNRPIHLPAAYFDKIIELGLFDPECARELLGFKTEFQYDSHDLPTMMRNGFQKSYNVKMGLHHFENSSTLAMNILEAFDITHAYNQQNVIVSLTKSLPMATVRKELSKCTRNIKKSVPIPSLDALIQSEEKGWLSLGERVIPNNSRHLAEKWGQNNAVTEWKFSNSSTEMSDDDAESFSSTSTNPHLKSSRNYPRTVRAPSSDSSISTSAGPSTTSAYLAWKKKNGITSSFDPTPVMTAFGTTVNEITSSVAQMNIEKRSSQVQAMIKSLKDDGTPGRVFAGCAKRGGRGGHQ